MTILAIEFSSVQRSVALVQAGSAGAAIRINEVTETGGRATRALGMISEALRAAGLEREQIDCLAIGLGPGSYTGVRATISLAQGWELARGGSDLKLLGVNTADCLAAQTQAAGVTGSLHVVIDAQRGEYYLGGYDLNQTGWSETAPLRLASRKEIEELARSGASMVGPELEALLPGARNTFPSAGVLGRVALLRRNFLRGEELTPIYLREPQFVKAPPPRRLPA